MHVYSSFGNKEEDLDSMCWVLYQVNVCTCDILDKMLCFLKISSVYLSASYSICSVIRRVSPETMVEMGINLLF